MKRFIFGALLLLGAGQANAQGEYRFSDFVNTHNGFTVNFEFRNRNLFTDPTIVGFDVVRLFVDSPRVVAACAPQQAECNFARPSNGTIGNVQTSNIVSENGEGYRGYPTYWSEDSCPGFDCLRRVYYTDQGQTWGCQVQEVLGTSPIPGLPGEEYNGRTCEGDGYDGWFRFSMIFYVVNPTAPLPVFDTSDLRAEFRETVYDGPSITTAPEPSTWVMVGFGLLAILRVRRKQKA
jgi:hypothetical protein